MLVKLAFAMQGLKKYLQFFFVIMNKDAGGELIFYKGDTKLMGVLPSPPPLGKT